MLCLPVLLCPTVFMASLCPKAAIISILKKLFMLKEVFQNKVHNLKKKIMIIFGRAKCSSHAYSLELTLWCWVSDSRSLWHIPAEGYWNHYILWKRGFAKQVISEHLILSDFNLKQYLTELGLPITSWHSLLFYQLKYCSFHIFSKCLVLKDQV